jgi:hypothetical protein
MADAGLESRIKRLEDLEEIKQLMSLYCYHADNRDGANWSQVFTEDGVFETDIYGTYEGRATIRALEHRSFAIHYNTNPIIDIDGDKAVGRWLLLMPCSFDDQFGGKRAVWAAAKYVNDLARVNGKWLFKRVRLKSIMWTPFDQGWEEDRFIDNEPTSAS